MSVGRSKKEEAINIYSRSPMSVGRSKKEEAIKSIVSAINNVLTVGRGCYVD
jgi:hypothetical protein